MRQSVDNVDSVDNFGRGKRRGEKLVFLLEGQDGKISTNSEKSFSEKFVDIVDSYF